MSEIFYYKSPFGVISCFFLDGILVAIRFLCKGDNIEYKKSDTASLLFSEFDEYFAGKRSFFTVKYAFQGTDFQKKVWNELIKIPYSEVRSYGEVAEALGNRGFSRAVGNACNKNPLPLIIPCHRVVAKNGIGGFSCGTKIKKRLLNMESSYKSNLLSHR